MLMACAGAHAMTISASSSNAIDTTQTPGVKSEAAYLRADDRIRDLLNHPAFAGFARLALPWDDRDYDDTTRLGDIATLLPYHTHVNPDVVVSSLNRMIDDATAGKTVFHDIYTKAQKRADPTRENTGMFFFRGQPNAPFAVIAPGGGFAYVASVHEGFPYAVEISNRGYNAFVLKYRAGQGGTAATQDLAAAVAYIFRNARCSWCEHDRLFIVGQFCGRTNGGGDRFPWHRPVWRSGASEAVSDRDGVHRTF